jgi:tRNA(adenine34) deaminase
VGETADITDIEDRALRAAIGRALHAYEDTQRTGIAAAVIFNGTVVAIAENRVHQENDPTRHAEIVALGKAAGVLGPDRLGACTLISTLQPCEMCLAAIRFAGIGRIVFAARQEAVAAKYFVFPGLGIDDFCAAGDAFSYVGGVRENEVLHLYADGEE